MIRVAISVEGQTEEEFVKRVLAPHLMPRAIDVRPILLGKARARSGLGGNVTVDRLTSEIAALYHSFDFVTSLVDFYGFRDRGGRTVEELEGVLRGEASRRIRRMHPKRVFPYVQRHEFESLLFADIRAFATLGSDVPQPVDNLRAVRARFPTPEDINDNPATAPSQRIVAVLPRYRKRIHGPDVAERIGLNAIRAECPRFHDWLTRLESLQD